MRKYIVFGSIFIILVLLGIFGWPFVKPKQAALQVTSSPRASVFLDGNHVGQTPYFDEKLKGGEYSLKLVPEDSTGTLLTWETKVKLSPQILTVVNRHLGPSDSESSGEILTLSQLSSKTKTSLSIISIPDSAVVTLNGQPKGFTPVSLDDVSPGEHTLALSAPGYQEKTIKAKVTQGYKLTISFQLAKQTIFDKAPKEPEETDPDDKPEQADEPESSTSADTKSSYIEILENNVGFLRVRKEPSTSSKEVAQAEIGDKLPYLNESENGWYKVEYATDKAGWVARGKNGEYAKLVKQID